jgi:hypothetical protein
MESRKRPEGVKPLWSFETSLLFPVSARRRFVLRSRMVVADVSLIRMSDTMKVALAWYCQQPYDASWSYTHDYCDEPKVPSPSLRSCQEAANDLMSKSAHVLYAVHAWLQRTGPTQGPIVGPIIHTAMAVPRCLPLTRCQRTKSVCVSHAVRTYCLRTQISNSPATEYERCSAKS